MVRMFIVLISLMSCNPSSFEKKVEQNVVQYETTVNKDNYSILCCLDKIRNSNDTVIDAIPLKFLAKENKIKVYNETKTNVLRDDKIKNWLNMAVKDSIKAYGLFVNQNRYYLFSSPVKQATGLSVNFTNWLIVDIENNLIIDLQSLCNSEKSFFFNSKQEFCFVLFTYNESFYHEKDYDNIIYDIEECSLSKEGKEILKKYSSKCKCQ